MIMDYPKLRPVEAVTARDNLICLRDPLGISERLICLPPELFFIVSLFDGNHSILDIQAAYTRRYGTLLFSDKVREIIEKLDSYLFLESDRFYEAQNRAVEEFRKATLREASHAGTAYEKDREALLKQIESLFDAPEGPGLPASQAPTGRLRGLIAPHIDIRRGGACFALSYAELARECSATTFIVLGISHVQTRRRFVLTEKDFDTPLGVLPVDRDFIASMRKQCTIDFFEDEFVHKSEHSVEFQALFLRYLFPAGEKARFVPILCSSRDEISSGRSPSEDTEFLEFTSALKSVCEERGGQACIIAGVDLSHLGQRFGQNLTMTPAMLKKAEIDDRRMIQFILDRDAEGFIRLIQEEKDSRNVCGVPAIYTLLKLVDATSVLLLKYDQSVDPATQSVVTFMSAAFYG